jgi:hypothetical protein
MLLRGLRYSDRICTLHVCITSGRHSATARGCQGGRASDVPPHGRIRRSCLGRSIDHGRVVGFSSLTFFIAYILEDVVVLSFPYNVCKYGYASPFDQLRRAQLQPRPIQGILAALASKQGFR